MLHLFGLMSNEYNRRLKSLPIQYNYWESHHALEGDLHTAVIRMSQAHVKVNMWLYVNLSTITIILKQKNYIWTTIWIGGSLNEKLLNTSSP